jgi:hypothetical protein
VVKLCLWEQSTTWNHFIHKENKKGSSPFLVSICGLWRVQCELEIAKKNPQHQHFEGHVKILSVSTKPECCISKLSRVSLQRSSLRLQRKSHNIDTLRVMWKFCQFQRNQNVAYLNCPEFLSKDRAWDCKEKPTTSTLWGSCENSVSFNETRMLYI